MKRRLDQLLVERALVRSRSQGREFIRTGRVRVAGEPCLKPGCLLDVETPLDLDAGASAHRVGRGYDKLNRFLDRHPLEFVGRFVVDGGAATGGFTQAALERGAGRVLAVDRGRDQLDPCLLADGRVASLERRDLREVRELPAPCEILLLDLSFISLCEVIPQLDFPLAPGAHLLALVKPQYELPPAALTASGRVKSAQSGGRALAKVGALLAGRGWEILASEAVEPGPDQLNREYFILAQRTEGRARE